MATVHQRLFDEQGLGSSVASLRRWVAANLPEEVRRSQVRDLLAPADGHVPAGVALDELLGAGSPIVGGSVPAEPSDDELANSLPRGAALALWRSRGQCGDPRPIRPIVGAAGAAPG